MKVIATALLGLFIIGSVLASCNNTTKINDEEFSDPVAHPSLILTQKGVEKIKTHLGAIPIFDKTLAKVKVEIDSEIEAGFDIPVPKDYSGGYTHEQHKKNYVLMQKAGVLYQILDDKKYAEFVKQMLLEYAKLYPTLPIHPKPRSYARGKLFWQCLNDSNWLVYASQAYDCIYNYLSEEERKTLEQDLFKPFAAHISDSNPQFFNRVHNHSTWGNAAVGMIALVMNDEVLLKKALYGLPDVNIDKGLKDNDGGFINKDGKKGFFANLDKPFSPDGYYTEGPYYQRYAMYPFLIFAQALQNKRPDLKVLSYKDSVLLKGVNALLNLSDQDGDFFLLNDAQKGMSYYNTSLVSAVDIAYHFGGNDPELLSIAEKQAEVTLDDAGLAVAIGIQEKKAKPFVKSSIELSDGTNGDEGAVAILRSGGIELVHKYTAHGLSHGHYDKLSFALFEGGEEVIQDYGMARFVNVEQKGGGNYLKENTTWAKQTVAHNALVQNETSHFQGKYDVASEHHSEKYLFNVQDVNVQVSSAKEVNAYPGTQLHRTFVLIKDSEYEKPYMLDILKVVSENSNRYDLPLYYLGQVIATNFDYTKGSTPQILGTANGYQHLYQEVEAQANGENLKFTWILKNKFYTYTAVTEKKDRVVMARIGASDPEFNLRQEPAIFLRKDKTKATIFANVIESHGSYNPVTELAVNAYSNIEQIEVVLDTKTYTAVQITHKNGKTNLFVMANNESDPNKEHSITINGEKSTWKGPYILTENK